MMQELSMIAPVVGKTLGGGAGAAETNGARRNVA
jgi:hypothetical protein